MNISAFITSLELLVKKSGSQKMAAEYLNISEPYLSDILHGKRDPGDKLLRAMKFKKVISYVPYE